MAWTHFFHSFHHYFNEIIPALIIGFFLSGVIHEFIPDAWVNKHLGQKGINKKGDVPFFIFFLSCLRCVMNQRMTNQTLRERFKLPEDKTAIVSQVIGDAVEINLIKLDDTATASRRYARYLLFWA